MFRTKSLSSQEMKNLIQRNRPSQIQKQNRNFSLRTLIADKTIKYHKHMEKLIQQSNNLTYSGQKSQKKITPRRVLDEMSKQVEGYKQNNSLVVQQFIEQQMISQITMKPLQTKQFQSDISIVYVESLPTFHNQKIISEQNEDKVYSYISRSKNNSVDRSAFKISLQNQQLMEENKELRRQIQHLQQRLETSQLIKIQKQSEAQSLKLKIKILQLKIQDFQQKEHEALSYYTKFSCYKPKSITIQPQIVQHQQIQTTETLKSIQGLQQLTQTQQKLLLNLKQQVCQLQQFLYQTISLFSQKKEIQLQMTVQNRKKYKNVVETMSELIRKQRQSDKRNLQNERQKNIILQQEISNLQNKYKSLEKNVRVFQTNLQEKKQQIVKLQQKLLQKSQSFLQLQRTLQTCNLKIRQLQNKLLQNELQAEAYRIQIRQNKNVIEQQKQKHIALQQQLSKVIQQYQEEHNSLQKQLSATINEWENKYNAVQNQFHQKIAQWKYTSQNLNEQIKQKVKQNCKLQEQNSRLSQNLRIQQQNLLKLKQLHQKKVNNLINLLNLAQMQIKSLLLKLRQAKDHDVANYKEMIAQFVGKIQGLQLNQPI